MAKWIPENERLASTMFICPHCKQKVYYLHGASARRKDIELSKQCLYLYCPWCAEPVDAYCSDPTDAKNCMECEHHDLIVVVGKPIVLTCDISSKCCYLTQEVMKNAPEYCPLKGSEKH